MIVNSSAASGSTQRSQQEVDQHTKNGAISQRGQASRTTYWFVLLSLFVMPLFCSSPLLRAQVAVARINGTVTDSSGAVITGALVVLTDVNSGVKHETITDSTGDYSLVDITPGQFTLEVSKTGFATQRQATFTLSVNQTATYNFALPVGNQVEVVKVEGSPTATLQTGSAELGTVVAPADVNNLPLNGRNFTQILNLTPGVSTVNVSQNFGNSHTGINPIGEYSFPSVGGQTNRSNVFLVDGLNDQDQFQSTYTVAPILDTIQEFKVDSHNDQAQFGGAVGGVVNVVTKSGSNQLHGVAWEFLRNAALDARNPLLTKVTPYTWNQFGGDIGGPVVIPHIYHGKNRTFFFGSYEGYRLRTANSSLYLVPTPAEINGDFSGLVNSSGNPIQIYNPFSTRPDPSNPSLMLRDPFPNNKITPGLIDTNAQKLAAAIYPAPVATGVPQTNGLNTLRTSLDNDEYDIRIDEQLGQKDSFWWRLIHANTPSITPQNLASGVKNDDNIAHNWGASWTHTFRPTTVMALEFGRNYGFISNATDSPQGIETNLLNLANYVNSFECGYSYTSRSCYLPSVTISGYGGWGDIVFTTGASDLYQWNGSLTQVAGKHTFTMGADFNKYYFHRARTNSGITYGTAQTSNLETSTGGDAFASFLLGVPVSASYSNLLESEHGGWEEGFYFQDQWRPNQRLTLNLGVRYDLPIFGIYGAGPNDPNAHVGDLDLSNGTYIVEYQTASCASTNNIPPCIPGGALPANVVLGPSNGKIFHTPEDNIQPRFGFAYQVTKKDVVRGSYTRVFDDWAAIEQTTQNVEGDWPSTANTLVNSLNTAVPNVTSENPLSTATTAPPATPFNLSTNYANPHIKNPYSWQWNFGIQHAFEANTIMTLNYAGATDLRLDVGAYQNVATTPGAGCIAPPNCSRLPYPYIHPTYWDNGIGKGYYHAFELSMRKASDHLSYIISYTWSKMEDLGADGWYGAEGTSVENPYNLKNDKSVAGFSQKHIFSGSWVYKLPFGTGQQFQTHNRGLDYVLGPWAVNGILSLSSGIPFTLSAPAQIPNTGNIWERPNYTGQPLGVANRSHAEWFNTAAYQAPPPYTFGNVGRNSLLADWPRDLDLSIFRTFPIRESTSVEFRAEAFNFTNSVVWGTPDANVTDSSFGAITSTENTPRQIQFALKIYF